MSRSDINELLNLCASNYLSLGALQEIINALGRRVSSQVLCFHEACVNKKVTLEIVQLLHSTWPGALRLRDDNGYFPIHYLCLNKNLDETASLDILRFMLEVDPTLPRELMGNGCLPIHDAALFKSTAFCKILIDAFPESLRIESDGWLPIHLSCGGKRDDTSNTIQYMLELDPELINAEDNGGYLPIHIAAMKGRTELIELLLKFDSDAASKKTIDGSRLLPLHLASYNSNLSSIQVLYDAYPEAILARSSGGRTPVDLAEGNQPAMDFLQTQIEYAEQSRNTAFMTTVDENGWLPLHHALKDNASLGSIILLMRSNPAAMQVSDQNGAHPLHIACELSSVKVVKYLVELAGDTLNNVDANKDSPLHYACRGGNLGIVKYLLEANVPSVSERNNNNKLAIHLLFDCGENVLDKESMEYVETVQQLILANPEVVRDFTY